MLYKKGWKIKLVMILIYCALIFFIYLFFLFFGNVFQGQAGAVFTDS